MASGGAAVNCDSGDDCAGMLPHEGLVGGFRHCLAPVSFSTSVLVPPAGFTP